MFDLHNGSHVPSLDEIAEYVENPLFLDFCGKVEREFKANCKIEFSKCSMAHGWNVKYKKGGKGLCTIYPDKGMFTVLVVVGQKEKDEVEVLLPTFSSSIRRLYRETRAGNGQKWLMIELTSPDDTFQDTIRLLQIRLKNR